MDMYCYIWFACILFVWQPGKLEMEKKKTKKKQNKKTNKQKNKKQKNKQKNNNKQTTKLWNAPFTRAIPHPQFRLNSKS